MKRIIIIAVIVLGLLAVTCASAADSDANQTNMNVQVPEKIWKDGNSNITVETDSESEITISGAFTYNSTLSPGKTEIPIKDLKTGRQSVTVNERQYNITVIKENPDWDMDFSCEEGEILYGPPYDHEYMDFGIIVLNAPEGLTGNFTFFVNGEEQSSWNALDTETQPYYYGEYFDAKTYNFTLKYSGDDYYHPAVKSKILEFKQILISIPEEVVLGYDDKICLYSSYEFPNGNVIIRINGKEVYRKTVKSATYDYVEYSLSKLEAGKQYDIEVEFNGERKNATVKVTDRIKNYVTFRGKDSYYGDDFKFIYGDDESNYYIYAPKINLNILIDGEKVSSKYEDEFYIVNIKDLKPGHHTITVSYTGDKKYAKNTFENDFEVVARPNFSKEIDQYATRYIRLTLPDDAIGILTVDIKNLDDNSQLSLKSEMNNGYARVTVPTEHVGHFIFHAYFNGNYELNEMAGKYLISDRATWELSDFSPYMDDEVILTFEVPTDANGNMTVEVEKDGKYYKKIIAKVIGGNAEIRLPTEHIGEYSITTSFDGDCEILSYKQTYQVYSQYSIEVPYDELKYNAEEYVSISLPYDAYGFLTVLLKYNKTDNYTLYKTEYLVDGEASIALPTQKLGKIYYSVLYDGDYEVYNITDAENMINPDYTFKNNRFYVNAGNVSGTFWVHDWANNKDFSAKAPNGTATIDVTKHLKEIYEYADFYMEFVTDDENQYDVGFEYVKPIYDIKIVASGVSMYYGDAKVFKAKVYRNGKPVIKGQSVKIKIGAKTYTVKTDKNGIAKIKITQVPKKYAVKVTYKGKTKTAKITVKQVLKLKTVKVKKSARKLVLKATLKKGKKAIRNKKITFKFNGKKYTAKTNKKGIAKVTVKKSVLKKLKKGKKITYSATYVKDTVKKTVKVR